MSLLRPLFALLLLLPTAACQTDAAEERDPARLISRKGDFVEIVMLTGTLEAEKGAWVNVPRLPSWQSSLKWLARDGTEVQAGDRVAELDNSSFASDIDEKRRAEQQAVQELTQKDAESAADLAQKELDVERKRTDLEKARADARVDAEVLPRKEFEERQLRLRTAQTEYDKAKSVLGASRTAVQADRRNLVLVIERARREIRIAEEAMQSLVLRSPDKGIFIISDHPWEGRKLQQGDPVWVGFPIGRIPDLQSLQVVATLADVDDGRVRPGMRATVTLDAFSQLAFPAEVVEVSAVAQEPARMSLRRSFKVQLRLDRVDPERMLPGYSVRVDVERKRLGNAVLVPRAAIESSGGTTTVRLADGSRVPVKTGDCNAWDCVILEGVEPGIRLGAAVPPHDSGSGT